jgi:hypothetical protein
MLEACCLYGDHRYVKICLRRRSAIVEYGEEAPKDFTKPTQSRKVLHLQADKIVIIKLE